MTLGRDPGPAAATAGIRRGAPVRAAIAASPPASFLVPESPGHPAPPGSSRLGAATSGCANPNPALRTVRAGGEQNVSAPLARSDPPADGANTRELHRFATGAARAEPGAGGPAGRRQRTQS